MLDGRQPSGDTRGLSKPKSRRGVVIAVALAAVAVAAAAYLYFSRKSGSAIDSVAVLPFVNASADPDTDYLSDGLSESLIDKLSELPQLKVIARSSSFKYRGQDVDLKQVADALGVRAIVTGKVARRGDDLSVRVEMVDARDNRQLWSEQYQRRASDAHLIQQEIAQAASEKLRLKLTGAQERQLAKRETANPQAYELLLKGRFYDNKGGTENLRKAAEYYQQAVAADPTYAPAYTGLAARYRGLAGTSVEDPQEYLPKAREAARRALELDDGLAEAHAVMGNIHRDAWEWEAAEREYRKAIELNANLGDAHRSYSSYLSIVGRHDEAIAEARRASELSPLDLFSNTSVGYRLFHARRYDEAVEALKKTLELESSYDATHLFLGYTYAGKGMYREAVAEYEEAIRLGDQSTSVQVYLGAAYAGAGEREKAREILKRLEATKEYVSPGELPVLYVALGERGRALDSLERAYSEHDLQLQFLKVEPGFDQLRSDPRFAELVRKVGLPQ